MANPSVTYSFTNGTAADATQVNQNFTDLINGLTDGTKSLSIDALTCAGTTTLNGAVNLGNATSDDITVTGYLASALIPKTDATYALGGASNAWSALYVEGATSLDGAVTINEAGANVDFRVEGDTDGNLLFCDASADSIGIRTNSPGGYLHISKYGSDATPTLQLGESSDGSYINVPSLNIMVFGQNNAETFRIHSNNNIGIGSTDPAAKLTLVDNLVGESGISLTNATNNSNSYSKISLASYHGTATIKKSNTGTNTYGLSIINESNGVNLDAGGTSWGSLSDMRYKKKLESLNNAVDKLTRCDCFKFYYLDDETKKIRIGMSAQQVKETIPEIVSGTEDGQYHLLYTEMIPYLVKSIQEQQQIIEQLKSRIEALESK